MIWTLIIGLDIRVLNLCFQTANFANSLAQVKAGLLLTKSFGGSRHATSALAEVG